MANHYHLLVETPKANLSVGMRQLNGIYTQSFNRRHKSVGHLFQGRFKAILVERESHLLELCRYIVLNPARVKGEAKASTWRWSSYRATAGLAPVAEFLRTDWILEQFGKSRYERSSSTGSSLGTEWRLGRGTISRVRSIWGVKRSSKNTLLVKRILKRYHERN